MKNEMTSLDAAAQSLGSAPWLLMLGIAIPMVWVAYRRQIYPTIFWMVPLSLSLVLSLVTIVVPRMLIATALINLVLLIVVMVDFWWLRSIDVSRIDAKRTVPRTCSINVATPSRLEIQNATSMRLRGKAADDLPPTFAANIEHHDLDLIAGGRVTAKRLLTPGRRGAFALQHVYIAFTSPMRFWLRHHTIDLEDRVNVYPDLKQMSDYAILARTNRLSQIGVRRTRRIGQDSDFERLRDYSRDDNYRHIDWRSTARRRKLTVRQFQSDQSQRIVFMLDCGRMMTGTHDGLSMLDYAINSMLMLAHVALKQGDSVGLLFFSDHVETYLPPRGGSGQMNRLIQAGFDRFPKMVESRYDQAFLYLSQHCKKRSLVALATNVVDEVNAASVNDYLTNLRGSHLPLAMLLRDRDMFEAADGYDPKFDPNGHWISPPRSQQTAMYRAAVAADILLWRNQLIKDLRHRGALVVDALPDQMTAPLINQYLNVKAKHLL